MTNRRGFLKNIALTAGGFSLLSIDDVKAEEVVVESKLNEGGFSGYNTIVINGKVQVGAIGVANAVVSDGIQVVKTNSKGEFNFVTSTKSNFVFLSIPAGYEIKKQKNGAADFFYRIDKSKSQQTVSFQLDKLKESDLTHHFIVWADPQIQKEDEAAMLLAETVPDTIETIKSLPSKNVFGIGCGDLVWDRHDLFESYNQAVLNTGIPFFQVFGNHDADLEQRSDEYSTTTFNKMYGPQYYSFNRGLVHYIVLDNVFFIGKGKEYIGYITEEQLAWLERDLQFVPKGSTVVVAQHIPSYTNFFERNPKSSSMGAMVNNREHLYKILADYKVHMMSGHTHFNENIVLKDNLYEHCHGTVCGAWWSGPICFDGTPGGYGVYSVSGADIQWYYKGTGLDKNVQFRVYKPNEAKDFKGSWCVNIWNWDPEWKAYYYEDGVRKGDLVQVTGRDPLSVKLHEGPKLPERRKWVEPELTDHLFLFNPTKGCKQVRVDVVDRFGRVYSESLIV